MANQTANSKEAYAYLIDPLTAPDPSDETGPGAHFRSTFAPITPSPSPPKLPDTPQKVETNPFRRSASLRSPNSPYSPRASQAYPTPPTSASPRQDRFDSDHRHAAFGGYAQEQRPRRHSHNFGREPPSPPQQTTLARGGSLRQRYPGDQTHRPLRMLSKHEKAAQRSPHLKKKHLAGADLIDQLDSAGMGTYHHEGPYDAALPSRNTDPRTAPVAAVAESNAEALKATPREKIEDSIRKGVPLSGTAAVAPGETDRLGNTYDYKEGENMMIADGGNYKRWPGVDYAADDMKGKGENWDAEKSLTQNEPVHGEASHHRHAHMSDDVEGHEMNRSSSLKRHDSLGKRAAEGIKRRLGSLRHKEKSP